MPRYVVERKGSNAANQPMEFDWVPVWTCEADSEEEAEKFARVNGVTVYNNQILKATLVEPTK